LKVRRVDWAALVVLVLALTHALWRLDVAPALFYDEGWYMSVARTWVEQGHYGRLLSGQPGGSGLGGGFTLVASVAIAFRHLGVGIWQARMVVVLYTFGALLLLYYLAGRLYTSTVATATLVVVLLATPFVPDFHPLLLGRTVSGETPMLFFLLVGYACLLLAIERSAWFLALTVVSWASALDIKLTLLPFLALSLGTLLMLTLHKRQKRTVGLLASALVGSLAVHQLSLWLWTRLLGIQPVGGAPVGSVIGVTALVLEGRVRLVAVRFALLTAGAVLLGVANQTSKMIQLGTDALSAKDVLRWSLLVLAVSWLAWYVMLSVGWYRYLTPAVFLGSVFAAQTLHDWTSGFDWGATVKHAARALRQRRAHSQGLRALLAVLVLAWIVPGSAYSFLLGGIPSVDTSVQQTANFLNANARSDALIEASSHELFFLLDRPYHYPPDHINVPVIEALTYQRLVPIDYDPLAADPDYLVLNWDFPSWIVYAEVVEGNAFRSLARFGPYEIYERVR
jgi:4-amino-4-deoxy-L-arabinose transferase-like glycosyltransferase